MARDDKLQHFQRTNLYSTLLRLVVPQLRSAAPERVHLPDNLRDDVGLLRDETRRDWQNYL